MRLKYYLRGAGIAMIAAAVLFLIAQRALPSESGQSETEVSTEREPSIAEAIRSKNTERETETEEELRPDSERDSETGSESGTEEKTAASESEEDSEDRTVITEHTRTETPEPEETEEPEEPTEKPEETALTGSPAEIVIYRGEGPTAVAERLQAAGAIENAEDYVTYLRRMGQTDYLETGHFSIPAGSDYETITKILTTSEDER